MVIPAVNPAKNIKLTRHQGKPGGKTHVVGREQQIMDPSKHCYTAHARLVQDDAMLKWLFLIMSIPLACGGKCPCAVVVYS